MSASGRPSKTNLHILALEPYWNLSHAAFLEGYRRRSRHRVEIWDLPARKWKWRMRGAAIHFADRARSPLAAGAEGAADPACVADPASAPDVVIASDFLNVAEWRALAPPAYRNAPVIAYFHENQVTYPRGEKAPDDFHYGWINLTSALAAERVLFNSGYHREEFIEAVRRTMDLMPDHVPADIAGRIRARSGVFPVGIDLEPHRGVKREVPRGPADVPVVAWNHRWEYDKDPDLLAETLFGLRARGVRFRVVVCGQSFKVVPPALQRIRSELGDALIHMGFVPRAVDYLKLLRQADVVLSTARQEFFGVAVVEAMFLGCIPVLPRRLSYPELVPSSLHDRLLYRDRRELLDCLEGILRDVAKDWTAAPLLRLRAEIEESAARFDWAHLAPALDRIVEDVFAGTPAGGTPAHP